MWLEILLSCCYTFQGQNPLADSFTYYEVISMTKFNNLRVKRAKSNVKYTESKLAKKRPRWKEQTLRKPLSYRYHAEKGITLKGRQHACAMPLCVLPFCVLPLCVMPFWVLALCAMPLSVLPFCVMPLYALPLSVLPFRVMPFSAWYLYDSGFFSTSFFLALAFYQLWRDIFQIWLNPFHS